MIARNKVVGSHAYYHADVTCANKAVQAQVGRVKNSFHSRYDSDVIAEDREVLDAFGLRAQEGDCGRGRSGFKADGEEDDLAIGMLTGEFVGIERRVDEAYIGSLGLGVKETSLRAWHAHHVAEGREDHAVHASDGDGIVDTAHWQHADGAARPVHQVDIAWQHILNAVLVDGVRMAAADLHQFEWPVAA